MTPLWYCSLVLRAAALAWSARLARRMRDRRWAVVPVLLALLTATPLVHAARGRPVAASAVAGGSIPDLVVSLLALGAVLAVGAATGRRRDGDGAAGGDGEYRAIFEAVTDGLILLAPDGRIVEVNAAAGRMHGYTREEFLRLRPEEFIHGDCRGLFAQFVSETGAGRTFQCEARDLRKDGVAFDVEVRGVPFVYHGRPHLLGIIRDITQRKQAERELRESEDRFRQLAENIPGVIYLCRNDAKYSMLYLNDAALQLTGYPGREFLEGRISFVDLYHPDDAAVVVAEVDAALAAGRPFRMTYRLRHRSGEWRWVEETGTGVLRDGELAYLEGFVSDVTERRRAEEARGRSEARLRAIIENTPNVAIEVYDADGVVRFWNGAAERLFGWTAGEAVGRTLDELILSREEAEHFLGVLRGIAETGRPHGPTEWAVRTKSGEERWAYSTTFAVPADGGPQFICMDVDTTDRRRAEDEARRAQQALVEQHQREAERVAAELAKARGELVRQTRLATLGKVSAQIAHEVRNPLGSIRNSCFYLSRKVPPEEAKCREHLALIEREIAACDRIIESLLDVTRVRPPQREEFDVRELVREVVGRLAPPPGVVVLVEGDTEPRVVRADRIQLRQVLDNLVENACDAVGEAGEVRVEIGASGEFDVIRVRDSGAGVAPEHRESVFDLLFTTKPHGTGLGLCVCRQIVEGHGGALELIDGGGPGAVFEVRLPRE